jgi:hypothetical protein
MNMAKITWRDRVGPVIDRIIAKYGTDDIKSLRQHFRDEWPWGEREGYPYRVWLQEIRKRLGLSGREPDVPGQRYLQEQLQEDGLMECQPSS